MLPLSILNIVIAVVFVEAGLIMGIVATLVVIAGLVIHMIRSGRGSIAHG